MKKFKEFKLVVSGGKGGVGKSMLCSALAMLFNELPHQKFGSGGKRKKIVAVDCDVDAPNLAIWLNEDRNWQKIKKISTSSKAIVDYEKCTGCGLCAEKCHFNAIKMEKGRPPHQNFGSSRPVINPFLCEGCAACEVLCPQKAIKLKPVKNGRIKIKKTKQGFFLVSGQLLPGETGSGKIVTEIKKEGEKFKYDIMLIDSSPGTGCPVIASLQGTNFVVLVTEPTPSGFSDLNRVLEVVNHFDIPYNIVINKWDINPNLSKKIEKWAGKRLLGKISYDKNIFKAISNLTPILETNLKAKKEIEGIYYKLIQRILKLKI